MNSILIIKVDCFRSCNIIFVILGLINDFRIALRWSSCFFSFFEYTNMLSTNTSTKFSKYGMRTLFIRHIMVVGVFVSLNGTTINAEYPYLILNMVL